MNFDYEVRDFIISNLTKEEESLFYEKIFFVKYTGSLFRKQVMEIFKRDNYKGLFSFGNWYFNFSKGENSQNNFCIQLLKLQLIENYDNFINSLKNKNPEEMMLKNQFIKVLLRALSNEATFSIKIYYEQLFNQKCPINDKDEIIKDIKNKLEYQE